MVSSTPTPAPRPLGPIRVTRIERELLGIRDGWELYGRGDEEVVRVQFAAGQVTRTPVPDLNSTGRVSFLVAADTALVRPLDFAPGHAIPDGRPAQPLVGALNSGGLVLPGPTPETVWHLSDRPEMSTALRLVEVSPAEPSGGQVQRVARLNRSYIDGVAPDGTGSFVYRMSGRLYLHGRMNDRRLPGRTLLAAGPRAWLVADCPTDRERCSPTVVDRATGARRTLPLPVDNRWMSGAMSPDAGYVALRQATDGGAVICLLDLRSGRIQRLPVVLDDARRLDDLAWSPDGRFLFLPEDGGGFLAFKPGHGEPIHLDLGLPALRQLAVKP